MFVSESVHSQDYFNGFECSRDLFRRTLHILGLSFLVCHEGKDNKLHMKKNFNEESLSVNNLRLSGPFLFICYVFTVLFSYLCSLLIDVRFLLPWLPRFVPPVSQCI